MKNRFLLIIPSVLVGLASADASAQAFTIPWFTIDGGGDMNGVAGRFTIASTTGQTDASSPAQPLSGGTFTIVGGFWAVAQNACDADFNTDGAVNSQDLFDFLTAFFASDLAADFNRDGVLNSQDFFDFLAAFFEGCN